MYIDRIAIYREITNEVITVMKQKNEIDEHREKQGHEAGEEQQEFDGHQEKHGREGHKVQHEAFAPAFHGGGHGRHGRGGSGHELGHHAHDNGRHELAHFGGRARRGEVRFVLMDALRGGPKHGYELVKALEERSEGQYVPSPGVVYPTLQTLLDEGLVSASQEGDRRVFQLTDLGQAELAAHAAEVEGFWARFAAQGIAQASRHEVAFLEEELESLSRTIWGGLDEAIARGDQEMIRRVRQAVVQCRDNIRDVISGVEVKSHD